MSKLDRVGMETAALPRPARTPSAGRGRRVGEDEPRARQSAPNVPGELAVLLAEVERLQGELSAAHARMKELEARADVDAITDILNRRGFDRELARSLAYVRRYGTRAALICIDLDGFKAVNDRHGHAAGDAMLRAVAGSLTRSVRASDTVARLGGDEFGLILWNLGAADAAGKAWSLEAAIVATVISWGSAVLSVGASVGYAMLGADDAGATAMAKADQAMYARKAERKGIRQFQL